MLTNLRLLWFEASLGVSASDFFGGTIGSIVATNLSRDNGKMEVSVSLADIISVDSSTNLLFKGFMVKVNEDKFYQLFIFTKKERKKFSEVYKQLTLGK